MKGILKFIGKILLAALVLVTIVGGFIFYDGYNLYKQAVLNLPLNQKVEQMKKDINYVSIENIPETLQKATISIEDHRFDTHKGIDFIALVRAMLNNLEEGNFSEGGSTITQQLAQNMYFRKEKKLTRKIAEALVANEIENAYDKKEILELYLNIVYYGDGYYGIGEATKGYFDKTPTELTLYEQTLLAGIPNAPSVYALSNKSKYTYQRQNQVISAMVKYSALSQEQADDLIKQNEEKIK